MLVPATVAEPAVTAIVPRGYVLSFNPLSVKSMAKLTVIELLLEIPVIVLIRPLMLITLPTTPFVALAIVVAEIGLPGATTTVAVVSLTTEAITK